MYLKDSKEITGVTGLSRDRIVYKKLRFQNSFRPYENETSGFSNSSDLKSRQTDNLYDNKTAMQPMGSCINTQQKTVD